MESQQRRFDKRRRITEDSLVQAAAGHGQPPHLAQPFPITREQIERARVIDSVCCTIDPERTGAPEHSPNSEPVDWDWESPAEPIDSTTPPSQPEGARAPLEPLGYRIEKGSD